jgi:hypothetical protein
MGSLILLRSRNAATGDRQAEYDLATQETIVRVSAAIFDEDFIGPSHAAGIPTVATVGYPWIKKTVQTTGTPTVAAIANAAGGIVAAALDATGEKQEASLYAADVLNWDATKSAVFETRLAMAVLPSAVAVEAVFGLHSAWIDGPDNATAYVDFQLLGSGAVNARIKDGVSSPQSVATGITLVAGVFHNFRFDLSDPTNVGFYIDGAKVSPVAPAVPMTFAATGATAILQPYFSVYKTSPSTGVATMQVDSCQLGMNRS